MPLALGTRLGPCEVLSPLGAGGMGEVHGAKDGRLGREVAIKTPGPLERVTRFPEGGVFLEERTLSPDGRCVYCCRENGSSSLWLMTLQKPS